VGAVIAAMGVVAALALIRRDELEQVPDEVPAEMPVLEAA
jgi:hypothetical protein